MSEHASDHEEKCQTPADDSDSTDTTDTVWSSGNKELAHIMKYSLSPKRQKLVAKKSDAMLTARTYPLMSVVDMHCSHPTQAEWHQTKLYLLAVPVKLRWLNCYNHDLKMDESMLSMTLLLTDETGLIKLELYHEVALTVHTELKVPLQNKSLSICLEITNFRICIVHNVMTLTPMKKMVSTPRTIVKFRCGYWQCVEGGAQMSRFPECLYVRYFPELRSKIPVRISIAGHIRDVDEATLTDAGDSKQCFILQPLSGSYVTCVALGRHVESPTISCGTDVILYFAWARPPQHSYLPATIWVYDDAHIVISQQHDSVLRSSPS